MLITISYKNPIKRKLAYIEIEADNVGDAIKKAPKSIRRGKGSLKQTLYNLYGVH